MKRCKKVQSEFYNKCNQADTIVIFIHGITEGTDQFRELADICNKKGWDACALCLPGHGKNGIDFARSSGKEWDEYAARYIDDKRSGYSHIVLVGHSMGGLLAVNAYMENSDKILGIVSFAAPYHLRMRFKGVVSSVKMGLGIAKKNDAYINASLSNYNIIQCRVFTFALWIPRYMDLFRMMRRTKKQLCDIKVPMLFIQCKRDEFASMRCVDTFEKSVSAPYGKTAVFEHAGHFFYREDKEKINEEIIAFIADTVKQAKS